MRPVERFRRPDKDVASAVPNPLPCYESAFVTHAIRPRDACDLWSLGHLHLHHQSFARDRVAARIDESRGPAVVCLSVCGPAGGAGCSVLAAFVVLVGGTADVANAGVDLRHGMLGRRADGLVGLGATSHASGYHAATGIQSHDANRYGRTFGARSERFTGHVVAESPADQSSVRPLDPRKDAASASFATAAGRPDDHTRVGSAFYGAHDEGIFSR